MILKHPDGTETFYETRGDPASSTLLLLHGIGADHAMWQPQLDRYAHAGYRLLAPDLFGHGRSSKLNHIDLADWRRQLNWLLQANQVEKCTLIGASMGGVIAQSFVVNHPHLVEKLIITDSFGELKTVKEKLLGFSQVVGFHLFKLLGNKMLAKGMQATYKAAYAHAARDYFAQVSLTVDLNQMILARKAINRIDVLDDLKKLRLPALILVGAEFGRAFIETNRKIADALPNAKFIILEQSMDPSNLVNPVNFDKQVFKFLQTDWD
jgi:pimeloyl-ACP methyl ester carboxylesterase